MELWADKLVSYEAPITGLIIWVTGWNITLLTLDIQTPDDVVGPCWTPKTYHPNTVKTSGDIWMFRGIYEVISPPLIYNYFVEPTTLDRFDCFLVVSRELRSAVDCSDKCDRTLGRTYHEMGHQGSLDSWDPFFLGGDQVLDANVWIKFDPGVIQPFNTDNLLKTNISALKNGGRGRLYSTCHVLPSDLVWTHKWFCLVCFVYPWHEVLQKSGRGTHQLNN